MAKSPALSAAIKHAPPLPASDDGLAVPGAKNAKVIQVCEHWVPGVPGKSIKGVTVDLAATHHPTRVQNPRSSTRR